VVKESEVMHARLIVWRASFVMATLRAPAGSNMKKSTSWLWLIAGCRESVGNMPDGGLIVSLSVSIVHV
jgi:hypothetical protein